MKIHLVGYIIFLMHGAVFLLEMSLFSSQTCHLRVDHVYGREHGPFYIMFKLCGYKTHTFVILYIQYIYCILMSISLAHDDLCITSPKLCIFCCANKTLLNTLHFQHSSVMGQPFSPYWTQGPEGC